VRQRIYDAEDDAVFMTAKQMTESEGEEPLPVSHTYQLDPLEVAPPDDPHSLEYRGLTTEKKRPKNLQQLARDSVLSRPPALAPVPFHIKLIEEIVVKRNEVLGLFSVR